MKCVYEVAMRKLKKQTNKNNLYLVGAFIRLLLLKRTLIAEQRISLSFIIVENKECADEKSPEWKKDKIKSLQLKVLQQCRTGQFWVECGQNYKDERERTNIGNRCWFQCGILMTK